ncbi:MAG: 30S ribosomal protein S16 [Thermodesulfobacteriota bacterium]|nr:30S ribosomal protein S16 [Thermodesulfobacteriota bacterium]
MPVKIRLTRKGTKKRPFYRIIATDSESPRDGKFLEVLGYYDPFKDQGQAQIDKDRVEKWVQKGAKISETVSSLLRREETQTVSS